MYLFLFFFAFFFCQLTEQFQHHSFSLDPLSVGKCSRLDPTLEESILAGLRRQLVTTNKRVRFLLLDCLAALVSVI